MRHRNRFAIALAATVYLAVPTEGATPFQPSDLIDMPTSRVLGHRVPVVTMSMLAYASAVQLHTKGGQSVSIGLYDWAEVGFSAETELQFGGFAKVRINHESARLPALAIGVQNLGSEDDISEYGQDFYYAEGQANSYYVVASKSVDIWSNVDVFVHFGMGSGRFRGYETDNSPFAGLFGGAEAWLSDDFRVSIEEDGNDTNIGASFRVNSNLLMHLALNEVEAGFHWQDDRTSPDPKVHPKLSFGMNYLFDFLRPPLSRKEAKIRDIHVQQQENRLLMEELEILRQRRRDAEAKIDAYRNALGDAEPVALD